MYEKDWYKSGSNSCLPPSFTSGIRFKGFTLAEVLITLGIIGVVAALTIPTVISSVQHKELEVGLKNAYSTLSEALKMYEQENGFPVTPAKLGVLELKPILMKYIKIVKDCGMGAVDGEKACIPHKDYVSDPDNYKDIYITYNGQNTLNYSFYDDGQFIMNNGMLILINNPGGATQALTISVDVNGYNKKPNRLGQDLFMFQITNNGILLPMGAKGTTYSDISQYCSKTSIDKGNGMGCTEKALYEKGFFNDLPK